MADLQDRMANESVSLCELGLQERTNFSAIGRIIRHIIRPRSRICLEVRILTEKSVSEGMILSGRWARCCGDDWHMIGLRLQEEPSPESSLGPLR